MTKREKEFWEMAYLAALAGRRGDPDLLADLAVEARKRRMRPKAYAKALEAQEKTAAESRGGSGIP